MAMKVSASVVALVSILLLLVPLAARASEIIVGGDQHWRFGFNYAAWADEIIFEVSDTLVFKYDAPNGTNFPHSVVQFNNSDDYDACNVNKSTLLANVTQGAGEGFRFPLLNYLTPYFFACGIHEGFHCRNGTMKFAVQALEC